MFGNFKYSPYICFIISSSLKNKKNDSKMFR